MDLVGIYHLYEIGGKKNQEDYIWPIPGRATLDDRIFIVCDGVGGSENGEIASRLISEFIAGKVGNYSEEEMSSALINELLEEGRRNLMKYASEQRLNDDMATTFSLLVLYEKRAFIAWCGDTRVYHLRHGNVLYKTEDHSLVNALVKEGEITNEEARLHPQKNIILRAIKADGSPIDAEGYWVDEVEDGDYFMLCTDGILENVSDDDIKFLLNQNDKGKINLVKSFQQFCFNKTRDNYSMYLVKIRMAGQQKASGSRIGYVVFFLLIIISLVLFGMYYSNGKKNMKNQNPMHRADSSATGTDQVPSRDSLPYVEFEKDNDGDSGQAPASDTMKKR
jgi:serine/threonine protein phosphatase PrpC